uniref:DUF3615 domain-containing protein n=1 Tax=Oryza glumipatula TaxID=40148 RepID=A0A0E0AX15_9ORYZ
MAATWFGLEPFFPLAGVRFSPPRRCGRIPKRSPVGHRRRRHDADGSEDSRQPCREEEKEEEEEEHGAETASAETLGLHQHPHSDHSGPLCAEKGHAASAQTLLEASSMIADSSSSSQPKAVAVAQDTIEFSEPSGRCLSLSPVSRIWSRLMHQWGLTFYIRVDLQGSFHTYPDVGGPFPSLQEAHNAIDRHLEGRRHPKLWLKQDGVSAMDIIVRQSIYWPDGSIRKRTKSYATEKTHKRMCQLVQALDLAHKLKDVLHYQSVRDKCMGYYHLNFTTETKESDDLDASIDNLFFVEIKHEDKIYYGCANQGSVDMKHPDPHEYDGGHLDLGRPYECVDQWSDSEDDAEYVKAKEAKIRRMYEPAPSPSPRQPSQSYSLARTEEEHVVETASAKAHADPLYAKEGHVPSSITATSSSCQQADAVAQDTEVLPPSGSCLSSSPASHVWARHVKDWGLIFYIRVDLQGSFHTYPDVGGPFQSSQEADKAIDRYLEDHRDPKMRIGQNDDISSIENVIRRCLYWPDGTIKRRTKSSTTWEAKKRMHQFIQALVDKIWHLNSKDVLHYQPLCENHMWYYHLNFTAKTKEDGFDSTSDNLFFVEVKCMGKGNYEEMVVSFFCMVNPIDNGKPCKGCTNNGTADMKHPDTGEYFAGHLDAYLPYGCFGQWSDSDDDDKYVKAKEAKLRRMFKSLNVPESGFICQVKCTRTVSSAIRGCAPVIRVRPAAEPRWPPRPCWECCLHRRVSLVAASIVTVAGVILLLGVAWFVHRYRNQRKWSMKDAASDKSRWVVTSFHKPEFNEEDILSCLDEEVVGVGRTPSSDSKKQATPSRRAAPNDGRRKLTSGMEAQRKMLRSRSGGALDDDGRRQLGGRVRVGEGRRAKLLAMDVGDGGSRLAWQQGDQEGRWTTSGTAAVGSAAAGRRRSAEGGGRRRRAKVWKGGENPAHGNFHPRQKKKGFMVKGMEPLQYC